MDEKFSFFRRYLFVPLGLVSAVVIYVTLTLAQPELPPPPGYEAPVAPAEGAAAQEPRSRPPVSPKHAAGVAADPSPAPSVTGPLTNAHLVTFEADPLRHASQANLRLVREALKNEADPKAKERLRSIHMMMADGLHDPDEILRAETALEAIAK